MIIVDRLRLNLEFGKFVEIDYQVLDEICDLVSKEKSFKTYEPYSWDNPLFWLENENGKREVSQYFAVGNAINFRYWWKERNGRIVSCKGIKGGIEASGALYMWRSLRVCYDQEIFPILDADKLSKISLQDFKKIFRDDRGNIPIPSCQERVKNWQDLGEKLREYWGGEFYNLLKETKNSLYNFIQYSRQFRAFDDPLCKMTMV
ncbi:MAG: queuosine salvage family protein, partial [Candidatus Baldrarchaeia archaeon]